MGARAEVANLVSIDKQRSDRGGWWVEVAVTKGKHIAMVVDIERATVVYPSNGNRSKHGVTNGH